MRERGREERRVAVILRTSAQPLPRTKHERNNTPSKNDVKEQEQRREEHGAGLTTDENKKSPRSFMMQHPLACRDVSVTKLVF